MNYFQDSVTGEVYAFNSDVVATEAAGVYSFKTAAGLPLTAIPTTLQPCPGNAAPAPAMVPISLSQQAQAELDRVTGPRGTIIRCAAAGLSVPVEWTAYVKALRAIANGTDTTSTGLPTKPAYPAGT
jgi:hypothetical protein